MNQFFIFYFVVTIYVELDYDVQNRFKSYQCFYWKTFKAKYKTRKSALSNAMDKVYVQQKQTEGVDPHKQTHAHIHIRSNSKRNKA